MPLRKIKFIDNNIYHVMNRGNGGMKIFRSSRDQTRFCETFNYYLKDSPQLRLSKFHNLSSDLKMNVLVQHKQKQNLVEMYSYCLMSNHFHFLVKQLLPNGISTWIRKSSNSYSAYFNKRYKRKGSLFQSMFAAVHVSTDEQLLQTQRYIHLNPLVAGICDEYSVTKYIWSSFGEYLDLTSSNLHISKHVILDYFTSVADFRSFTLNQENFRQSLPDYKDIYLLE